MITNKKQISKTALLILAMGVLTACQTVYDAASDQEKRDFCKHIENQNAPDCAGNHTPDLPSS